MERRHFLKIAFGFTAGVVVMTSAAKVVGAAPLAPQLLLPPEPPNTAHKPQAALATQNDLDGAQVEQVRWRWHWGHRRHWRWHRRRHWGHRRRYRRRWHW